ncbi:hypothetical protein D9615_006905 [Tricholomella constricta]|uniref:Uncharacterized protein n=1 Tax=Tricholomella constricta TaxID=117010 RepID=A0A8H5M2Y7_9AGAR|nr:hypothetical protein D9615_006905 [Tricholomella constricta]
MSGERSETPHPLPHAPRARIQNVPLPGQIISCPHRPSSSRMSTAKKSDSPSWPSDAIPTHYACLLFPASPEPIPDHEPVGIPAGEPLEHHTDVPAPFRPSISHYRRTQWFLQGAPTTVDRPVLDWAGRFFLHNVSHGGRGRKGW